MNEIFGVPITIEEGQTFHLKFGKLRFHCTRLASEWQISQSWEDEDFISAEFAIDFVVPSSVPTFRYIVGSTKDFISIIPRLPKTSIVVHPTSPILVPKGTDVTFYISSTLWLDIEMSSGKSKCNHEVPLQIDSETWFGDNKYEGELCCSSTTHARMNFNALPKHFGRSVTALNLKNKSGKTIQVDRLNVPIPFLSLFQNENNYSFTNDVFVELEGDNEDVDISIKRLHSALFGNTHKVSDPRKSQLKGAFKKAVNTFFQ